MNVFSVLIVLLFSIFVSGNVCFVWNGSEFIQYTILGIVDNSVVLSRNVDVYNISVNVINRSVDVENTSINIINKSIDVYNVSINIINKDIEVENVSVNVINKILNVTNVDVIQHNRTVEYIEYELYKKNIEDMSKQFNNLQNLLYIVIGGLVFIIIRDKLGILSEKK